MIHTSPNIPFTRRLFNCAASTTPKPSPQVPPINSGTRESTRQPTRTPHSPCNMGGRSLYRSEEHRCARSSKSSYARTSPSQRYPSSCCHLFPSPIRFDAVSCSIEVEVAVIVTCASKTPGLRCSSPRKAILGNPLHRRLVDLF